MTRLFQRRLPTLASTLALAAFGILSAPSAFAGGFQLWEQSAAGTGDYHAGGAAEANDAGTNFYNPAGLTRLKHAELSAGAVYIPIDPRFTGTIQTQALPAPEATQGWVHGNTDNWVPNFHAALPINNRLALGLSVTTPFGLATDYPKQPPIDAVATRTQLRTININPNIAYQVTQKLSVAAGLQAEHGSADFDEMVFAALPDTNHLTGWGTGYDLGVLYQSTAHTRFGVSYRSAISINASGTSALYQPTPGSPPVNTSSVSAKLTLPATTILSLYHDINKRWSVMASAYYTQWSKLKTIVLNNIATVPGIPMPPSITNNYYYHNTWNTALGVHYRWGPRLMLKFGVGYDQTPTNDLYRDVRLPDGNRFAVSAGAHITANGHTSFDLGYTHLFTGNVPINNQGPLPANPYGVHTLGTAKTTVNVVGLQANYIF